MPTFKTLLLRNVKMFFKDKGLFFVSLITPLILLVLYATFLSNVYRDSFIAFMPDGVNVSERVIGGLVGGQLFSSLLAVCPITVAFCSNMLMVQDKMSGARQDLLISPLKKHTLALSYYLATFISTYIICIFAVACCFVYLAFVGWYYTFIDVLVILLDVTVLVLFGTALSSLVNNFLSTQGQISAVGTIVSSCYGFICGAYMPISSFSAGLQKVISFLPGTYSTALLRNHCMGGAIEALGGEVGSVGVVEGIKNMVDCNVYFFDNLCSIPAMYGILGATIAVCVGLFVLITVKNKSKRG